MLQTTSIDRMKGKTIIFHPRHTMAPPQPRRIHILTRIETYMKIKKHYIKQTVSVSLSIAKSRHTIVTRACPHSAHHTLNNLLSCPTTTRQPRPASLINPQRTRRRRPVTDLILEFIVIPPQNHTHPASNPFLPHLTTTPELRSPSMEAISSRFSAHLETHRGSVEKCIIATQKT